MWYLQDLAKLFHDIGHWPAAWLVGLAEDGSQLLHRFGSGAKLLAGYPRLL